MTRSSEIGPQTRASSEIFSALFSAANPRRRETLTRLKEACDEVGQKKPLKLKALENYVRGAFGRDAGPRAQSISNERALGLGMYHYVEARERERKASARPCRRKSQNAGARALGERIEAIANMDLRADMRDLLDRLAVSEKDLARAKVLFRTLDVGFDFDAFLEGRQQDRAGGGNAIEPSLVTALGCLVGTLTDQDALSACGLCLVDGRIRRKGGTGDELISPAVLSGVVALRDCLALRGGDQP